MTAFAKRWKRFGFYGILGGWLAITSYLAACQANVDLISEKRIIDKIEGSPRCEQGLRVVEGQNGTATLRVYLVDDGSEEIPPGRLQSTTTPFTVKDNLSLRPNTIRVIDADTGAQANGVTATLTLVDQTDSANWIQENPNYALVKQSAENLRAPRAVSLLIDMSETAAGPDFSMTRGSSPTGWLLSVFNQNQQRGNLDALAVLLMKNNLFTRTDNLFLGADTNLQLIGASAQPRGFVVTSADGKDILSRGLLNLSNGTVNLNAPLYGTVREAAVLTRDVSWDESANAINNPAVIALSLSQDAHVLSPKDVADDFANAQAGLRGQNSQFVPFMGITYPKPAGVKDDAWEDHLNKLCELARVAGTGGANYFGQVFFVRKDLEIVTGERRELQNSVRDQLDMAFHAMGGWLELKVSYQLSGAQAGKRYLVAFGLNGKFLGETTEKSSKNNESFLIFEVKS